MKLCNRVFQYIFFIYFCFAHDLNHIDPATVKQEETSIPATSSDGKTIGDVKKPVENSNLHILSTPSTPVQTQPSITDTAKSHADTLPPTARTISSNEEIPSAHTKSHIPTSSNTDSVDLPSNLQPNIVQNEAQSTRKIHIHPRHIQTEDKITAEEIVQQRENDSSSKLTKNDSNSTENQNRTLAIPSMKNRQICWHLPKKFQPSIELLEDQLFRLINTLPDFLQAIFFGRIDDREVLMNTMWFGSICTMCCLFSFLFLSMGTKRLKQSKQEKEVRSRCQQLQRHNNQIELERATFERQNQKLSEQIDELKNLAVRDTDDDVFALRTECTQLREDGKTVRTERDALQQTIDQKEHLIRKYEYEMKGQAETVAHMNNQIRQLKQDLEKERTTVSRIQSNDFSLEHFEKSEETIRELKSTVTQLTQEKFQGQDQLREVQEHSKQLILENHQLTIRMKRLKDLLEHRDGKTQAIDDLESNDLLSTIDNDMKKSQQHLENLQIELETKTSRVKELEMQCKQEKDRCREMETKLKVVLELRERDAHLHIRQLGQTDAELRKARTDADRVRILQQQLDFKQQQFDDMQKVHFNEQTKFNEDCSKLQRETHEKWIEVKRLTRELDASKKECETLRKQITKYTANGRSSQEKFGSQHFGDSDATSTSPISHHQGDNFRPIDQQRNDSGTTSPTDMFIPRPPLLGLSRPPFYPSHFLPSHPPNLFMMHPRFPMPPAVPHGTISPIQHWTINGNDMNSTEMVNSTDITPNSISCDGQVDETADSPSTHEDKPNKSKKVKKSAKKKTRSSAMIEDV